MTRARAARRVAMGAVYGGGGLGLLSAGLWGLLTAQARLARRAIGEPAEDPPSDDGSYGHYSGPPIRLAILGDSSAAGLGVADPEETFGALVAAGLAEIAERPVVLTNIAEVGARSSDLPDQVVAALAFEPTIALIVVGGNDVTHRVRPSVSVRHLEEAVRRLRESGCEVVVGTCPDLGTIEPIPHPLKLVARRWSRHLAAAQTIVVVEAGGRTVSLGEILGPEFEAAPGDMFSADRFHPSEWGYAAAAAAVLPSVASALGLWSPEDEDTRVSPRDSVLPISIAAAAAAEQAGTEVLSAEVAGRDRGPRGRWAILRRRGQQPLPAVPERDLAGTERGRRGTVAAD